MRKANVLQHPSTSSCVRWERRAFTYSPEGKTTSRKLQPVCQRLCHLRRNMPVYFRHTYCQYFIQVLRSIGKGFLLLLTSQLHQSSAGVPTFARLEPTHCHQSVVSAGMSHLLSVIKLGILTPSWSFVRSLVTHCNAATAQWKIFMRTSGIFKHGLAECCHHDHST